MKIAALLVVPCAIALLLGGVKFWPVTPTTHVAQQPESAATNSEGHDKLKAATEELQARYRAFVSAQSKLTVPTDINLASLQTLFDQRERLRQQSFSPAEQDLLFGDDRLMEQWTLRRKALAEASTRDQGQLASELALWLAAQPQWFQEAEANSRLLGELQGLAKLPPAQREAILHERAGPEAVDRMRQLELSRQGFNEQLAGYLNDLKQLPTDSPGQQQQELLARWFEPGEWRRVEALTRLAQTRQQ